MEFYSFNSIVETMIKLECEVLDIEDGYLRVHYHFGEDTRPFYRNDDLDLNSPEALNITFNQTYENQQVFTATYQPELKGIKAKQYAIFYMWHQDDKEIVMELNKQANYDAFFQSDDNEMLFSFDNNDYLNYFGSGYIPEVTIKATPKTVIKLEGKVEMSIFGVPIRYGDIIIKYLELKEMFVNNKYIGSDENFSIVMPINFVFEEDQNITEYFMMDDIISSLGGIAASLKIFMGHVATVVIIQFIYTLAEVIMRKYKYKY